MSENADGVVIK